MATGKKTQTPAEVIVGTLLSQFKDELNTIQDHANPNQSVWGTQSEIQQMEILDRFTRRIRASLDHGFSELFAEGVPSVRATVANLNFKKKGIVCTMELSESAEYRHELADSSGAQVLIVITPDIDAFMESAAMVKPDSDQNELALDNQPTGDLGEPVDDDPRTHLELIEEAQALATAMGEPEVAKGAGDRTRAQLIDYITWAEKQRAKAG